MMMLRLSLFLAGAAAAADSQQQQQQQLPSQVAANSPLGLKLLSQARRLEDAQDEDDGDWTDQNQDNAEDEYTWVAGYSLKFQGCHHIKQFNMEADENEDVRIITKRLARFRLCPSSSCSSDKAAGCRTGYGDYIVDLNTYVEAYFEAKQANDESECERYLAYECACNDDDNTGETDFDEEQCEYDCFANANMYECIDEEQEDGQEGFDPEEFMQCAQWNPEQGDRRRLDQTDDGDAEYFIGPYCANQGGAVLLGVFTDDACTEFADNGGGAKTFKSLSGGQQLPYASSSVVGMSCLRCVEPADADEQEEGDQYDEDSVLEQCEDLYKASGKCESNLPEGIVAYPNEGACTYMEGIKITRMDGIVMAGSSKPNPVVTFFIVLFAALFCALGYYVWYLRFRLGIKKNSLL